MDQPVEHDLQIIESLTSRLLDLVNRRRGGTSIRWRLEALRREIEHEINAEQLAILKVKPERVEAA